MLLFMDGCDGIATADIVYKWTAHTGAQIEAAAGKFGGRNILLDASGSAPEIYKDFTASGTAYFTWYWYPANNLGATDNFVIAKFMDGASNQCEIMWSAVTGMLSLTRNGTVLATDTVAITAVSGWYLMEVKLIISATVGEFTLKVNGATRLTVTGANTKNTANSTVSRLYFVAARSTSTRRQSHRIDDVIINDATGGVNNGYLGERRIVCLNPSADGTVAGTPSAGANYQCVDEATPNGDTDYVFGGAFKDLYDLPSLASIPISIVGVQCCVVARKDDAAARTVQPKIKLSGTEASIAAVALTTTYAGYNTLFDTDPGGGAWSDADITALQAGFEAA